MESFLVVKPATVVGWHRQGFKHELPSMGHSHARKIEFLVGTDYGNWETRARFPAPQHDLAENIVPATS